MSINLNLDLLMGYEEINGIKTKTGFNSKFSIDDEFRTRSVRTLLVSKFDGDKFQGSLSDLEPGVGYEVKVAKDLTFKYDLYNRSADWLQ